MEDIEDTEFVAPEHDHLIRAISRLDKTQHISEPTRSELAINNSEFHLVKRSNKLNINNVVKVLEDTAHHVQISKKLKKNHDSSKVLTKPLEKPQSERIKRSTGYEQTKVRIGRWDAVVARARTADYVSFPLKRIDTKSQTTKDFLSKLKLKSQLEKELEEVDPPAAQHVEEEEEQVYPMSYEEMIEHRQHLAKFRAQQSYKAAKAKQQSKIKSKKYHRILKKEKLKQQLKEFEELQKSNPEEALKKLEVLEKTRALERHTLRHKNTGKWAKSKLVRAKYDKEVRQQLAEQLAVSRGLTQKPKDIESSDDEVDENENIPDINLTQDPMNPWMMKRLDKPNINSEFDFGYKKYIVDKMYKIPGTDSDSEIETSTKQNDEQNDIDFTSLKDGISKICSKDKEKTENAELSDLNNVQSTSTLKKHRDANIKKSQSNLVATSNWTVVSIDNKSLQPKGYESVTEAFDTYEGKINMKVEKKLKRLRNDIDKMSRRTIPRKHEIKQTDDKEDSLQHLYLKKKKSTLIDEELVETSFQNDKHVEDKNNSVQHLLKVANTTINDNVKANIDPSAFIHAKPKYLSTNITGDGIGTDQLDDDEQVVPKVNIEEVFEEDDVVASFRQEKEDDINKDKPENVDLSLPGWGSWGGKGVIAPKRKRNRFILKAAPQMPRRDENKGDIIIKEYKDPNLAAHKVSELPYPFNTIKEYEASIRAPIGNTFIPEKAHQKLIRPSVITKSGTIIAPMDEEELLVPKNRKFKNANVISLISKK